MSTETLKRAIDSILTKDAEYKNQNTWEQAVKAKYPEAEVKWNGSQTYTATVNGQEVGRFNYGAIRGGNLTAGKGYVKGL